MVEANKGKDNWANQIDKSTRKRKHKKAFGGQVNWQEKRAKKRAKKQEMESGAPIEPYKIDTFVIGSEKFNEYYTVSTPSYHSESFYFMYSFGKIERVIVCVLVCFRDYSKM